MKCPICSEKLLPGTDRCRACGYRMPRPTFPDVNHPAPHRPARSGCRWGCCAAVLIIPLILVILSVVFSLVGYVTEISSMDAVHIPPDEAPESSASREPSGEDSSSAPRPAEAAEDLFFIEDGAVYFDSDRWDGSPVLTIPETVRDETVTAIGPGCFQDCSGLTTIVLPDTVTRICDDAFAGCSRLRGLYLPTGTESIGTDAFAGCIDLEAICIPSAVTDIAAGCFDDCASLIYIIYEGSFEQWQALYSNYITPFTAAVCLNGTFYHGTGR